MDIYQDIATRTGGDIYVGVVGPVRTGKSTFIKRFMEELVIPSMEGDYKKSQANDELPQSSSGKTIMTTEPKFIPNEAAEIAIGETKMKVRLIDCVGYVVPAALGYFEDNAPRMVKTPWQEAPMPFKEAAELGTDKVMREHSTIGVLVTADGSFGELSRADYEETEARVVGEMKAVGKPFVIVLNCAEPTADETKALADRMAEAYGVAVIPMNCAAFGANDAAVLFEHLLLEFPIREIKFRIPLWIRRLEKEHWLRSSFCDSVLEAVRSISKLSEIPTVTKMIGHNENVAEAVLTDIELGDGSVIVDVKPNPHLFYKVLSEIAGTEVEGEETLIEIIREFSAKKHKYEKIENAMEDVYESGYGVVYPDISEMHLEDPEIVRQGGRFGVKLKASAPSVHMIRADIETEVSPIVGSEKQSEDLVNYLLEGFEENPEEIWQSNIFGKSLHELVNEGLNSKLSHMPEDARDKIRETLTRVINDGSGGLICLIF